jgi:hypothetical protein
MRCKKGLLRRSRIASQSEPASDEFFRQERVHAIFFESECTQVCGRVGPWGEMATSSTIWNRLFLPIVVVLLCILPSCPAARRAAHPGSGAGGLRGLRSNGLISWWAPLKLRGGVGPETLRARAAQMRSATGAADAKAQGRDRNLDGAQEDAFGPVEERNGVRQWNVTFPVSPSPPPHPLPLPTPPL